MKPLRWFGYKIENDKWWSTINDAFKPFEIVVDHVALQTHDHSYFEIDQFGKQLFIPKRGTQNAAITLWATESGYLKLLNFMHHDSGAKLLRPIQISQGKFPFFVEFETWNDFDSIENFLRMNNDHHQQSPH